MSNLLADLPNNTEKEVKKLMKNIHDGISMFSLPKLNQILKGMIRKPMKSDNIEFVLATVSSKFKMSKEEMINSKSRGKGYSPKIISWVLLHRVLGESIRDIATLFKRYPNAITHALDTFDNLTSGNSADGKVLSEQYAHCELKLLEHLQSQELK